MFSIGGGRKQSFLFFFDNTLFGLHISLKKVSFQFIGTYFTSAVPKYCSVIYLILFRTFTFCNIKLF